MNCLVTLGRAKTPGAPAVLSVDMAAPGVDVLQLPEVTPVAQSTGVAVNASYLFLVVQVLDRILPYFWGKSYFLLTLDRRDLSLQASYALENYADVHSIWLAGDNILYVVSTGTDEVVALDLDGPNVAESRTFWRPDPSLPREDFHHINAVTVWNGDVVVSGFGRRSGNLWSSANDGFIYNVSRGKSVASGLKHPHSVLSVGDDLLFCESRTSKVSALRAGKSATFGGYTRGLCRLGPNLLVAISRGRKVSKSTGLINNWASPGGSGGRCGLYSLDAASFAVEDFLDLEAYADEVYELLPVPAADRWPVVPELAWRDAALRGVDDAFERLRQQHEVVVADYQRVVEGLSAELESKIGEANRVIEDLQQKLRENTSWALATVEDVKGRDQTIQDLQQKLAEQSAWAVASAQEVEARNRVIRELEALIEQGKSS